MSTYPKSPKEMTGGMMYFPRMLAKIRLHGAGELPEDYHANLGRPRTADGACTNFLRVNYGVLRQRVLRAGPMKRSWNGFVSKLGWNDFASPLLEEGKQRCGITDRTDIVTIPELIDFDEKRRD